MSIENIRQNFRLLYGEVSNIVIAHPRLTFTLITGFLAGLFYMRPSLLRLLPTSFLRLPNAPSQENRRDTTVTSNTPHTPNSQNLSGLLNQPLAREVGILGGLFTFIKILLRRR